MKKSVMKKWVEALRSGEYVQGKNELCNTRGNTHKFCCLGVLTNLYVEENGNSDKAWADRDYLSKAVMKWSGINSDCGRIYSLYYTLDGYNDIKGYSFKKLATLIEKHYKEL